MKAGAWFYSVFPGKVFLKKCLMCPRPSLYICGMSAGARGPAGKPAVVGFALQPLDIPWPSENPVRRLSKQAESPGKGFGMLLEESFLKSSCAQPRDWGHGEEKS